MVGSDDATADGSMALQMREHHNYDRKGQMLNSCVALHYTYFNVSGKKGSTEFTASSTLYFQHIYVLSKTEIYQRLIYFFMDLSLNKTHTSGLPF